MTTEYEDSVRWTDEMQAAFDERVRERERDLVIREKIATKHGAVRTEPRIRVLFFPIGKPAEVREVAATAKGVQELLDGAHFDRVRVGQGCHLYVDDEGILSGLPPNVQPLDYPRPLYGPAVLIAEKRGEDGEFEWDDLTDAQIELGRRFIRHGVAARTSPIGSTT